jgi:EAL domain-containing protein (putative c-di-GMP-specific phosphodiesterase class I)
LLYFCRFQMSSATLFENLLNLSSALWRDGNPRSRTEKRKERAKSLIWLRLNKLRNASRVESALRRSLARGKFYLHYQPIFDQRGRVVEVEALLRADDPVLQSMGPGEYIPIAEETGLILPLGEKVLRRACARLAEWRSSGLEQVRLAINVSCIQLLSPSFAERAVNIFAEHGIPPGRVHLELTETTLLRDTAPLTAQMQKLADAGVRFSIDDFGTGYSSLDRLSKLPISTLKIDQSFVKEITENSRTLGIVKALADLARHLHLDLIAEGVERSEQIAALAKIGCHKFQGYLLSRPLAPEMILGLMLAGRQTGPGNAGSGAEPGPELPEVA